MVYNTAIHACAGGGDWRHALELLEAMAAEGLAPDYHSYSAAMLACQRAGEWERVLELLQHMETVGFPPTLEAYGVVVAACVRSKAWGQVAPVLRTMEERGVRPDNRFVEVLMKSIANQGQWRTALQVMEVLGELQPGLLSSSNVVYNLGIKACAEAREWKAASLLLQDMRKRGRRPDLYSYNTAIEACQAVRRKEAQRGPQAEAISESSDEADAAAAACLRGCRCGRGCSPRPARFRRS